MAKFDTTKYDKELERIAQRYRSRKEYIHANFKPGSDLEVKELEEAEGKRRVDIAKLESEFRADVDQKRAAYLPKKKEAKQSARDLIRQQVREAEQFPSLYSDALKADAELAIFEEHNARLERIELLLLAQNGGEKFFEEQLAGTDPDVMRRHRPGLQYLPPKVRAPLEEAFESRIKNIEAEQTSPELKEFDEDVTRFNASLEAFDKHGTYTDYRKKESPPSENETTLRPYEPPPVRSNGSAEGAEN